MTRWSTPANAPAIDELIGAGAKAAALGDYADDLEARIADGARDEDLLEEARATRAAALLAGVGR